MLLNETLDFFSKEYALDIKYIRFRPQVTCFLHKLKTIYRA